MTIILSFFFFAISFFGFQKDKSIVSPLFIMPIIWALFLFLYNVVPHGLYGLEEQFLFSLILWISCFVVGGYFINSPRYDKMNFLQDFSLYNKLVFNVYFFIVIITAPLAIMLLVTEAMKVGVELFFLKLRMINTGIDEDDTFSLGMLAYVFNFTNIVLLLFTYYKSKVSNFQYYVVLVLQILLGLITLARTNLLVLIISLFIILYFKNALKRKHYIIGAVIIFLFIFLITFLRGFHETDASQSSEFTTYMFAGMPAFDTIDFKFQEQFGSYTFRFYYAVSNALGGKYVVEKTILPYAYTPELTNVYTVMFPFFKDFGYKGVAFFGLIYGLLINFIYKFSVKNSPLSIIGYAVIFPVLLLQFFGEYLFLNFSTYLQFLIILLIPKFLKFK